MSFSSPTPRPTGPESAMPAETEDDRDLNTSTSPQGETSAPKRRPRRGGRRLSQPEETQNLTGAQRLLLLDTWRGSGLPAGDFAPLVGISKHTLYALKHKFETEGPAGLEEKPRGGPTGS